MVHMDRSSAAALALLLALTAAQTASACVGVNAVVSSTGANPAKPPNKERAYDSLSVHDHFKGLLPITDVRPHTASTFACVDSRGESGQLGSLGGDMAELAAGVATYFKIVGTPKDVPRSINSIFTSFMEEVATKQRPFYFHTSDEKLNLIFAALKEAEGAKLPRKPTVFPEVMPKDKEVAEIWLHELIHGHFQGCGHMRLMIDQFADYGLPSDQIPKSLIREFFLYWWPTPLRSKQREKVQFKVLQGPLDGKAVAIVDATGACPGKSPAAVPSHGGSQVFVYHAKAVEDFRREVLTPFFVKYGKKHGHAIDATAFNNALKTLQAKQLRSTLTYLTPANALPLWSVTVAVKE